MATRWSVLAALAIGCGDEGRGGPTPEDFTLAADGLTSIDTEAVLAALEVGLSGNFAVPEPDVTMDQDDRHRHDKIARTAVGAAPACMSAPTLPLEPALVNTVTFEIDCMIGDVPVTGSVSSTFSVIDGVHVEHESVDLEIDGLPAALRSSVDGVFGGQIETRRRTISLEVGDQIITGDWVATHDNMTDCGTKDGRSVVSFAGTLLHRTDVGLQCGDSDAASLTGGVVQLTRGERTVSLEFVDGAVVLDGDNFTLESSLSELRD